jgi:hypothetical protein
LLDQSCRHDTSSRLSPSASTAVFQNKLAEQIGFTIAEHAINGSCNTRALVLSGFAGQNPKASGTEQTCNSWYWSVVPAILIGVTVKK